jgi:hypothetical protein
MKIHVDNFKSNGVDIDEIIQNIRIGTTKEGVVNLHFETSDKYIRVEANGSCVTPDYQGLIVTLTPYIEKYDPDIVVMTDEEWNEYFNHPKYYRLNLVVETEGYRYTSTVIPLKHEYFVSFIPDVMVMNYQCLEEATLTHWTE